MEKFTPAQNFRHPIRRSPANPGPLPSLVLAVCLLLLAGSPSMAREQDQQTGAEPPALMLAKVYRPGVDLSAYWMSEKLDGVRAYWDGSQLLSRQGNRYRAPTWFTREFPATPLDGELWSGRQRFEALSGTVRKQTPVDAEWSQVRFMAFDLPDAPGPFGTRLQRLRELLADTDSPYLQLVEQRRVADHDTLMSELEQVVAAGGEGLMLHRDDAPYRALRSDDLLKVKSFQDAEARVISHLPGKGKYQGMLGALEVETADGRRFRIGTGFSDAQRRNPPALGSTITYRYRGLTNSGLPRFASFLRVREDR